MNPLYNIWNYNYIQQQAQQQYHQNQVQQVLEAAHKLQDYLDSADRTHFITFGTIIISSNKPNSSTIKIRYNKCWKRHTSCRIIWTVRTRLTRHIRGR